MAPVQPAPSSPPLPRTHHQRRHEARRVHGPADPGKAKIRAGAEAGGEPKSWAPPWLGRDMEQLLPGQVSRRHTITTARASHGTWQRALSGSRGAGRLGCLGNLHAALRSLDGHGGCKDSHKPVTPAAIYGKSPEENPEKCAWLEERLRPGRPHCLYLKASRGFPTLNPNRLFLRFL